MGGHGHRAARTCKAGQLRSLTGAPGLNYPQLQEPVASREMHWSGAARLRQPQAGGSLVSRNRPWERADPCSTRSWPHPSQVQAVLGLPLATLRGPLHTGSLLSSSACPIAVLSLGMLASVIKMSSPCGNLQYPTAPIMYTCACLTWFRTLWDGHLGCSGCFP